MLAQVHFFWVLLPTWAMETSEGERGQGNANERKQRKKQAGRDREEESERDTKNEWVELGCVCTRTRKGAQGMRTTAASVPAGVPHEFMVPSTLYGPIRNTHKGQHVQFIFIKSEQRALLLQIHTRRS